MSPTISKLPDFKPKSRTVISSEKPAQPKKQTKEEKSRVASQENDQSEVRPKKSKKDVGQEDIAAIKKKNEEYEIAFKKVSDLFYEWLENRAKLKAETSA